MKKYTIMVGKLGGGTVESTMTKVDDGFVVLKKWITKEGAKYSVPQSIKKDDAGMSVNKQGQKVLTFTTFSETYGDEIWEATVIHEHEEVSFSDF